MSYHGYFALAEVYDLFNAGLDYESFANYIEAAFDRFLERRPQLLLDLACGTGRMTKILSGRGYDMIGVDGSAEMLAKAAENCGYDPKILYLLQDMRSFELYGTVGAVISCLDSVNYLTKKEDLAACFDRVHNYLDPDGLFLFDVNTPYKFETVYGDESYLFEGELNKGGEFLPVFCAWQNHYVKKSRLCSFDLSVFYGEKDGKYRREDESQIERCYTREELEKALQDNGFEVLGVFGGFDFSAPKKATERMFFAARAKK
ncbi:MAG: class I SAM-dependent methyltransferase [Clostridia bacterium]|nr:class I SAM-dependent methyltransferase [Clostridia bacterium]